MKKLLLILLCVPLIGFASFPVIIGDQECERIIVSLQYDINQKIDNNQYKIHESS